MSAIVSTGWLLVWLVTELCTSAPTSTKRAVTVPSNGARRTSYDFITGKLRDVRLRHAVGGVRLRRRTAPMSSRVRHQVTLPLGVLALVIEIAHRRVVLPIGLRRLDLGHHLCRPSHDRRDPQLSTSA